MSTDLLFCFWSIACEMTPAKRKSIWIFFEKALKGVLFLLFHHKILCILLKFGEQYDII